MQIVSVYYLQEYATKLNYSFKILVLNIVALKGHK